MNQIEMLPDDLELTGKKITFFRIKILGDPFDNRGINYGTKKRPEKMQEKRSFCKK